jgi:hypothetical protein
MAHCGKRLVFKVRQIWQCQKAASSSCCDTIDADVTDEAETGADVAAPGFARLEFRQRNCGGSGPGGIGDPGGRFCIGVVAICGAAAETLFVAALFAETLLRTS